MNELRLYTKEELLKAIEYACGYQKASDYQLAGKVFLKDSESNVKELLDALCDTSNNVHYEISIDDIEWYLKE